jgi:hypothetical protein
VSAARDYINRAAGGELDNATVADLKKHAQPYFELLESIRQRAGSNHILTKEGGAINAETIYRLSGGDSNVHFDRDVSDVSASLDHLAAKAVPDVAHSLVASTVALNDSQFPAAEAVVADLDSLLVPIEAPLSYRQFMADMENRSIMQITLIVRYRDSGLVFSDRRASLAEIARRSQRFSGFPQRIHQSRH